MQSAESRGASPRRIWEFQRATGDVFRCDLEQTPVGWMARFSVNGQGIGGHRFDEMSSAIHWADDLLAAFREIDEGLGERQDTDAAVLRKSLGATRRVDSVPCRHAVEHPEGDEPE
nr:hypothetical protein FLJDLJJJ_00034 [uncultured bacterium]